VRLTVLHAVAMPSTAASTIQVMKMCQAFATEGHDVQLVVPDKRTAGSQGEDLFAFYGVRRIFAVRRSFWPSIPGRALLSALHMAWLARRFAADCVVSRFASAASACALLGLRVIYEAHRPMRQLGNLERRLFERLIRSRNFVRLVVISGALARIYETDYPELAGKILVCHDAADAVDVMAAAERTDARLKVGYVGSLYPGRGIELIVELAKRCPFADFVVVGGNEAEVAHWRTESASSGNITFHGFLQHPQAVQKMSGCDVLLAPYGQKVSVFGDAAADTSQFMSPLKIFEYMAAGKAIVCSDHDVLREVLEDGATALFCSKSDWNEWVQALVRLNAEPALRQRLGADARASLLQSYTWSARARRVLQDAA
jgi:glycosyltransferase involved in cell wall biosynthesis